MKQLLLVAVLSVILAACTSEAYDSGDTPLSYLSAEWADVETNSDGRIAYAVTDAGQRLTLSPPYEASWLGQTPDTTCRALLYHGQVSGGATEAKAVSPVLMLDIVDRLAGVSPKTDPFGNMRAWISANGKYLNLVLTLKVGRKTDAPTQQRIGLLRDSITTMADGARCCWLTIAHDQNGVPQYYSQEACLSVPMSQFAGVRKICLRTQTYQGEKLLEIN